MNTFLGLSADEWAAADGLPVCPWGDERRPLTVDEVKGGLVMMLRRLDEADDERWFQKVDELGVDRMGELLRPTPGREEAPPHAG